MALCFIIPPHILDAVAKNGTPEQKEWAQRSIEVSKKVREQRKLINPLRSGKK